MTETAGVIIQLRANVAQLEQGMQRAQRAIDRAASQIERRATRFSSKFEREFTKSARESAAVFEQAFAAEKSFGQLEQSLNPAIAALRRYEAAQETVKRAVEAGRVSQERAAGVLAQAQAEYQRTTAAIAGIGGGLQQGSRGYSQFGNIVQQAGFQVGDFAVQVASGGGVLRPFIQQGTQLISMFGPWGAVVGAAGAVVGALAVAFLGAGEDARTFEEALDELAETTKSLKSLNDQVSDLDALREKYGEVTQAVFALINAQRQIEREKLTTQAADLLTSIKGSIESILGQTPLAQAGDRGGGFLVQLRELQAAFQDLENAEGFKAQADAAARLRAVIQEIQTGPLGNLVNRTAPALTTELLKAEDTLRQAAVQTGDVRQDMDSVAAAADDAALGVGNAADNASRLAGNLERAIGALSRMGSAAEDRLERARASLEFRTNPVGLARRNAQIDTQDELKAAEPILQGRRGDVPSGFLTALKAQAAETVEALTEVARIEEEIQRLNEADKPSRGGGGGQTDKEARDRERAAEAIQKEIASLDRKLVKLDEERVLLEQRAQLQNAGASPESIARAEAVLTAELSRQSIVQELLNKAREEGVQLTPQQIALIESQAEATKTLTLSNYDLEASIQRQADAAADAKKRQEDLGKAIVNVGDRFVQAIQRADSFADALKNLGVEILNLAIQGLGNQGPFASLLGSVLPALFGSAAGSIGGTTAGFGGSYASGVYAKGGVFSGGNIIPFARGGIVSRPTIFPMARGAGLMGEAGPEAIMPLRRGPGGQLGVEASGGGGVVVNLFNNAGADVDVQQRQTPSGPTLDIIIDKKMAENRSRKGSRFNAANAAAQTITRR